MTDCSDLARRTRALHRHLEATAELPIERQANRWLGEAEAIAADLESGDLDPEVVRDRTAKIRDLLAEVEETGHDEGDDHLEAARERCREILDGD